MAVSYQHLRAFYAIAVDGGVSRAARRLNVSQPTLSQQLKALEERYGVTLFEGRKVPLRLTEAGHGLFALTEKLFATVSDIDDLLGDQSPANGGLLRLGSDNPAYAARVVEQFRRSHPGAEIRVRMGNAREVIAWLSDAQVDVVLASDPPADGKFHYEPLATDGLTCAMPTGHVLSRSLRVPVHSLAGETMLLRESGSKTRVFTERVLTDAGVVPGGTVELQGREMIRECIAVGVGVSLFLASECPPDERIVYRPLWTPERCYEMCSYLICLVGRRRSATMRALFEIAATFADETPLQIKRSGGSLAGLASANRVAL